MLTASDQNARWTLQQGIFAERRAQSSSRSNVRYVTRSDTRKEREAMAHSKIVQKIERLSEEKERLLAREGSHHADAGDHRRLESIDHALSVMWDLRRRELAGEYVKLDEDFLDRYVVSPGRDAPDGYRW